MATEANKKAFAFAVQVLTARMKAKARGEELTKADMPEAPKLHPLETELTDAIVAQVKILFHVMESELPRPGAVQAAIGSDDYMNRPDLKQRWVRQVTRVLPTLKETLAKVAEVSKAHFSSQVRATFGVDVITGDKGIEDALAQHGKEAAALIKDIGDKAIDRVSAIVRDGVRRGVGSRKIKQQLQDELGIASRRAELIATDQINKMNGALTRIEHENAGVTHYRWQGVMDQRERPLHVARDGGKYSWDNPPSDGHPGFPVRCRCWAEPVLDLFDGILGP